jgi:hypothetical protein
MGVRLAGLLVATSLALGGCMLISTSSSVGSSSCTGIPSGACQEQAQRITARHPGTTNVDLACGVPACTRAGGAGRAIVTLADNTTITEAFSYAGDPNPLPVPACTGIAASLCHDLATTAADDQPPSKRIVTIAVKCTAATCTEQKGEASIVIGFADGSQSSSGTGWESARQ